MMKLKPTFNIDKVFPKFFGCSASFIAKKVVITPFIRPDKFGECFRKENFRKFSGELYKGGRGNLHSKFITIIQTGMGGQIIRDCLFFLKYAGVERVVFLGSSGGLGNLKIGDLLLAERSLRNIENNNYFGPDEEYFQKLKDYFYGIGGKVRINLKEGEIFSLNSLFEQTQPFLNRLEKIGFSGVDLELYHFYQAAKINGLKAVGLCVVSDLPLKKPLGEIGKKERKIFLSVLNSSIINTIEFLVQND